MKELTPGEVRELLLARPTLIIPAGTTEQHGPHLPIGCDTMIVERLGDDLSAAFGLPPSSSACTPTRARSPGARR
jgi:creatinine amidohydrolase/Fe(II)-dependent formamide hydrolase-like protein